MGEDPGEPAAPAPPPKGLSPVAGCALLGLLALLSGAFCFGLGTLLFRDEIRLPSAGPAEGRLWLVREADNQGLGIATVRLVSGSDEGPQACVETRVRFLLWKSDGTALATRYCQCFVRENGAWLPAGDCPP
jgi:hypothetical protein